MTDAVLTGWRDRTGDAILDFVNRVCPPSMIEAVGNPADVTRALVGSSW